MDVEDGPTVHMIPIPEIGNCGVRDELGAQMTTGRNIILALTTPSRKITEREYGEGNLPNPTNILGRAIQACSGCLLNKNNRGPCVPTHSTTNPVTGKLPGYPKPVLITAGELQILTNWLPE